ncbi:MAG: hypothetical protein DMF53_09920, partial [Acidobacteria bacterium]
DAELLKSAALVYVVVGDQGSALSSVDQALKKGVRRDWFLLPRFGPLADDLDFLTLIKKAPEAF